MSTTTTPIFDFGELKRALEERDSTAQLALYAPNAEVTLVDRINTPGSPRCCADTRRSAPGSRTSANAT